MADKGIVMCSYMNRALLAKRKFRTMRAGSLKILSREADSWEVDCKVSDAVYMRIVGRPDIASRRFSSQYEVGDRLYVKEAYKIFDVKNRQVTGMYLADRTGIEAKLSKSEWDKWRRRDYPHKATSGRFMYKSLARIFMTVTKVTVQRPQELTNEECIAEGIYGHEEQFGKYYNLQTIYAAFPEKGGGFTTAKEAFECLWDSLHGEGSYDRNEWCFVYHWKNIEIKGD